MCKYLNKFEHYEILQASDVKLHIFSFKADFGST